VAGIVGEVDGKVGHDFTLNLLYSYYKWCSGRRVRATPGTKGAGRWL
jgi:hypothetical protein